MGAGLRSYQCYLNKFTQAINQEAFGNLYKWFFDNLVFDNYTLDFDSTVMVREGVQEGTVKGYNPKRPGRNSHHPLIAFVSDIRMIADYWLRPGNTAASTKHLSFLKDTLENLSGERVESIRMDNGFFTKETLDSLGYIVECMFTWTIKRELVGGKAWVDVADGIEMTETVFLAQSWTAPRRIVMVRQEIEKRPAAASKLVKQFCLLEDQSDFGEYRYSCFVTNLDMPP